MNKQGVDVQREGLLRLLAFQMAFANEGKEIRALLMEDVALGTIMSLYPYRFNQVSYSLSNLLVANPKLGGEVLAICYANAYRVSPELFRSLALPAVESAEEIWFTTGQRAFTDRLEPTYLKEWSGLRSIEQIKADVEAIMWRLFDVFGQMPYLRYMAESDQRLRLIIADQVLDLLAPKT